MRSENKDTGKKRLEVDQAKRVTGEVGEEQFQRRRDGEVRGERVAAGFTNNMERMAGYDWGWGTSIRIQAK